MNTLYPKYRHSLWTGEPHSALTGTGDNGLWVALLEDVYRFSPAHQWHTSLTGVVAEQEIRGVRIEDGVVYGRPVLFEKIRSPELTALAFYRKNIGIPDGWRLVAFMDQDIDGFPHTPNGGHIRIEWNENGIFSL